MWLSEARADIPIHLMGPNPGPGHGGMSCASPSKPTFSMAWRHNRNAKNAQSRDQELTFYLAGLQGQPYMTCMRCWKRLPGVAGPQQTPTQGAGLRAPPPHRFWGPRLQVLHFSFNPAPMVDGLQLSKAI